MYQDDCAHIDNPAKSTDGVRAVKHITPNGGILHNNARRHDHIFRSSRKLLQDEVNHLTQGGIPILEELRNPEEERGGLVRGELLAGEEEDGNLRE